MASPEKPEQSYNTDSVRIYLNEISKTPLLRAEEEVELAKQIEAGVYAEHLLIDDEHFDVNRPPRNQRMRDLGEIALQGYEAKDQMLKANLRLVVSIAKRYTGRGLPLMDIVQEGNLGLIQAVERFDYTKGYKFSTYATWWIRKLINRSMQEQARTITLPAHFAEKVNKLNRIKHELALGLGREATNEELAEEFGAPQEMIEKLIRLSKEPISLDVTVGKEEEAPLGDFIQDDDEGSIENVVNAKFMHAEVNDVLSELTEQEAQVIRMRFGIGGRDPMRLDDVGEVYGVSRERIRQIENKAMTKLRKSKRAGHLRSYIKD